MTTQPLAMTPATLPRRPATAFPLILIGLGIVFLLANAGFVDSGAWARLAALWPIALVMIGADLLLRDRSTAAVLLVEMAVVAASIAYVVAGPGAAVPIGTNSTTVGRESAQSLALSLNYGAGALTLHGGATALVEVKSTRTDARVQDVRYAGTAASVSISPTSDDGFIFGPDRRWDVALPSDMPVTLTMNVGAGDFDLDLRDVQLRSARISNGASQIIVRLARPNGDVPVTIETGASAVTFEIPEGVPYRVRTSGGLNTVDGLDETGSYGTASNRFSILVNGGMSTVTIK
jgi:hypothetical protein